MKDAARQRFFDLALQGELAGNQHPDVTAAVLAALDSQSATDPGALRLVAPPVPAPPPRRGPHAYVAGGFAAGAAACAMLFAFAWPTAATPQRAATAHVLDGRGILHRGGQRTPYLVDQPIDLAPRDSLRTSRAASLQLRLPPLGVLRLERNTEVEILAMHWREFGGGAALGSVTVAVAAGLIQWSDGTATRHAGPGENVVLAQSPELAATGEESRDELRSRLATAMQRIGELEQAAAREALPAAETSPSQPKDAAAASTTRRAAIRHSQLESLLDAIDWDKAGASSARMSTLLDKAMDLLEAGEQVPMDALAEIAGVSNEFLQATQKVLTSDLQGVGINAKYSNPVLLANFLDAHLDARGTPLSAAQRTTLDRVANQLAKEDELRRAGYPEDTPRLQMLLDDAGRSDRFAQELSRSMTPEQLASTFGAKTAGKTLDQFGSGATWSDHARPVPGTDKAQIASTVAGRIESSVGLDKDQAAAFQAIARRWLDRFPDEMWTSGEQPRTIYGPQVLQATDRVRAAAEMQLGMVQQALTELQLTATQRRALLRHTDVFVPYLRE